MAVFKCVPIVFSLYRSFSIIQTSSTLFDNLPTLERFLAFKKPDIKSKKNIKFFKKYLKIENIKFSYPNSKKQFEFNYSIKKNSKVLISGKSGCGKTTLVNIISGLIKPSNGFVKIDRINIENDLNGFLSIIDMCLKHPLFLQVH